MENNIKISSILHRVPINIYNNNKINIHNKVDINNNYYKIINYDEDMLCNDDIETGIYRSVIISFPEKNILAYAPPKNITYNKFKLLNPSLDNINITEYIDGKIIQIFYDNRIDSWCINGNQDNPYYSIEQEFILACGENIDKSISSLNILNFFPKKYSYTFILKKQQSYQLSLYLIAVYKLHEFNMVQYINQEEYENWDIFSNLNGLICFPKFEKVYSSYADIDEDLTYNYTPKKIILTNKLTGFQTSLSTNEYKMMKNSEKLDPLLRYQYLCLHRINKSDEYVKVFPNRKNDFYSIKYMYDWLIRTIHNIYIDYHIEKNACYIPTKYQRYINDLHNIYIKSLNKKKPILITKEIVQKYFNKKNPNEITTLLDYYEHDSLRMKTL